MKIGVISDIHANIYALEEVLKIARKEKVDKLFILGDIVGYYYFPNEVLNLLGSWDCVYIKGNHEIILENLRYEKISSEEIKLKYGSGHSYALEKLSENQLQFLFNLPDQKKVEYDGTSFLLCHGAPWANNFYLYPDVDPKTVEKFNDYEADFVLVGHSHYPFALKTKNSILINVGSIGQSRTRGGCASWCIFNTLNKAFEFHYTDYEVNDLIRNIDEIDPEVVYLKQVLLRNNIKRNV